MDPDLLFNVVVPLLMRSRIAFIGISTLDDPATSFWGQMMTAKYPDGRDVFRVIRYTLVCDACRAAGREMQCKHKLGDLPWWQDAGQHMKLEHIMKGHSAAYLRETKGVQVDALRAPAFKSAIVDPIFAEANIYNPDGKSFGPLFVSVDPGKTHSDYAIISAVYKRGSMTVRCCCILSLLLSLLPCGPRP